MKVRFRSPLGLRIGRRLVHGNGLSSLRRLRLFGFLLLCLLSDRDTWGSPFVFHTFKANGDGTYSYEYGVDNSDGSFPIFAWSLELGLTPAQVDWNPRSLPQTGGILGSGSRSIRVPTGNPQNPIDDWESKPGIPTRGLSAQDFTALDPLGGGDIQPGLALGGFGFTSGHAPGPLSYTLFGPGGEFLHGVTVGPVAIPEPGAAAHVTMALFVIGVCRWLAVRAGSPGRRTR